jgi:hypothetical protein
VGHLKVLLLNALSHLDPIEILLLLGVNEFNLPTALLKLIPEYHPHHPPFSFLFFSFLFFSFADVLRSSFFRSSFVLLGSVCTLYPPICNNVLTALMGPSVETNQSRFALPLCTQHDTRYLRNATVQAGVLPPLRAQPHFGAQHDPLVPVPSARVSCACVVCRVRVRD